MASQRAATNTFIMVRGIFKPLKVCFSQVPRRAGKSECAGSQGRVEIICLG